MKEEIIRGKNIVGAWTLGSQYDNNSIEVIDDDDNCYRIRTKDILKALKKYNFKKTKAQVHFYLEII